MPIHRQMLTLTSAGCGTHSRRLSRQVEEVGVEQANILGEKVASNDICLRHPIST